MKDDHIQVRINHLPTSKSRHWNENFIKLMQEQYFNEDSNEHFFDEKMEMFYPDYCHFIIDIIQSIIIFSNLIALANLIKIS